MDVARTSSARDSTLLRIKCLLNDEMRVLAVPPNVTYAQLQQRMLDMYGFPVNIFFEDAEGDLVSIKSQYEVDEAFDIFKRHTAGQSLRLYLTTVTVESDKLSASAQNVPASDDGIDLQDEPNDEADIFSESQKRVDPEFSESIQYSRGVLLGSGAFGQVFSALNSETGVLMAVKEIKLNALSKTDTQKEMNLLIDEIRTFSSLHNQHLVQYLGVQYVAGGSIASLLQSFGALEEPVVRRYTQQILVGLDFLHRNRIVHRDIKGANILIDAKGLVKLADFGAATRLQSITSASMLKSVRGTPYWMAPEVIHQSGHGRKSDIWSVGCTVFEMLNGSPPWSHLEPMSALFHIGTTAAPPAFPPTFSAEVTDFILSCMTRQPDARPSADELMDHPFLQVVHD